MLSFWSIPFSYTYSWRLRSDWYADEHFVFILPIHCDIMYCNNIEVCDRTEHAINYIQVFRQLWQLWHIPIHHPWGREPLECTTIIVTCIPQRLINLFKLTPYNLGHRKLFLFFFFFPTTPVPAETGIATPKIYKQWWCTVHRAHAAAPEEGRPNLSLLL